MFHLLTQCRKDKQMCLATQYYIDYFYHTLNFDMLVHIISLDFKLFANHNMTNFIVIKLMEKANVMQKMKLTAVFQDM